MLSVVSCYVVDANLDGLGKSLQMWLFHSAVHKVEVHKRGEHSQLLIHISSTTYTRAHRTVSFLRRGHTAKKEHIQVSWRPS